MNAIGQPQALRMTITPHIHLRARPFSLFLAIIATALPLAIAPSLARATQRFASPKSIGAGDCASAATACKIQKAFSSAATGDEVILAGNEGSYGTPSTPITSTLQHSGVYGLYVHGAAGQPRPLIYSSAATAMRFLGWSAGKGFTVSDIDLEHLKAGAGIEGGSGLEVSGAVDHVLVHSTASSDYVCNLAGSKEGTVSIIDSACIGDEPSDYGLFEQSEGSSAVANVTLRNDTFEAPAQGSFGIAASSEGIATDVSATNVIAHGAFRDLDAFQVNDASVTLALDHSNYATVQSESGTSITPPATATNQATPPVFADAASDDFHEAPGSPTIEAGANEEANGSTDLDGDRRTIGPSTDIGAYETNQPPSSNQTLTGQSGSGTGVKGPPPLPPGVLTLSSPSAKVAAHSVSVKMSCGALGSGCRGTLVLSEKVKAKAKTRHHKGATTQTVGSDSFNLTAGKTSVLKVTLSHSVLAQLAAGKHHRLTLELTAKRGDGGSPFSAKIVLSLPAARSPS
jgi:hypothetical protein